MGGDLGGLGDGPPKFEVGTAYAFVPPIFREVLLLDGCEAQYEVTKKVLRRNIFV